MLRLTSLSNRSRADARSLFQLLVRWARSRHAGLLALAAGLSSLALRDAALLARYTAPAGVDGYYYAVQIEALRESGMRQLRTMSSAERQRLSRLNPQLYEYLAR